MYIFFYLLWTMISTLSFLAFIAKCMYKAIMLPIFYMENTPFGSPTNSAAINQLLQQTPISASLISQLIVAHLHSSFFQISLRRQPCFYLWSISTRFEHFLAPSRAFYWVGFLRHRVGLKPGRRLYCGVYVRATTYYSCPCCLKICLSSHRSIVRREKYQYHLQNNWYCHGFF